MSWVSALSHVSLARTPTMNVGFGLAPVNRPNLSDDSFEPNSTDAACRTNASKARKAVVDRSLSGAAGLYFKTQI